MDERHRRVEIQVPHNCIHDFGGKKSREEIPPHPPPTPPPRWPPLSVAHPISTRRVAYLELRGGRHGGHKSRRYWCGYEPQSNGDDSARSFLFAQCPPPPNSRDGLLDTVHLTCHFPAIRAAICTLPIRTRRNF